MRGRQLGRGQRVVVAATVGVSHSDGFGDTLHVNADGGNDTVDQSGFTVGSIFLAVEL